MGAGCHHDPFVRFTVGGEPAGWRLSEMRGYQPRPHRERTGTYLFLLTGPVVLDQDPDEVARLVNDAEARQAHPRPEDDAAPTPAAPP